MKIIITEDQYKTLVTNLLDTLMGNIRIKTVKEKKEDGIKEDWHTVFDEDGNSVMSIWVKGPLRNKGCKKDLTLDNTLNEKFEKYMPYYRHKIFSKVLVDYIYDKLGIKCDCVQYDYDFKEEKDVDDEGDEYEYTSSKTRKYNVKNKKKIKESVEDSNVVEQIMDNEGIDFSISYGGRVPDKNVFYDYVYFWFKFSNTDVKPYKRVFYNTKNNKVVGIDRVPDFSTITDGFRYIPTEILNSYFVEKGEEYLNELLPIEYPKHNRLDESVEDSNVVEQIMEVEGVKYDGCGYGGRTYDNFGRRHDTVEVYFKLPDEEKLYSRRIHFLTKKNKVVSVDSTGDFRTITDGFRYIPTDILMGYFIEKAKTYVEKLLRTLYPNDSR